MSKAWTLKSGAARVHEVYGARPWFSRVDIGENELILYVRVLPGIVWPSIGKFPIRVVITSADPQRER